MAPRPPMTAAQTRLTEALLNGVKEWAGRTSQISRVTKATVMSVAAGAAPDGNALVVISWQGTDVAAPYVSTYTPVATHVVAVVKTGSQLLILGRIIGTP